MSRSACPASIRRFPLFAAVLLACAVATGCGGRSVDDSTPTDVGACVPPSEVCDGACVDLDHDPGHCGACGARCSLGEVCNGGECEFACLGGATACGGECVDLAFDPESCGACGVACDEGLLCSNGQCGVVCLGGSTQCGDLCVDTHHDPANCGGCGAACGPADACSGGECVAFCDPGEILCAGGCVDTSSDPTSCGGCGIACSGGLVCSGGMCIAECDPGKTACAGACVDLESSPKNCGSCGAACGAGAICASGECQCPAGKTACGAACVDVTSDPSNCGQCGQACLAGQTCASGACQCPAGTSACAAGCADTTNDPSNCGECEHGCGPGSLCSAGVCGGVVSEWGTLGYDEGRSGYNPLETGKPPLSLAWSMGIGPAALNPAVIANGKVFVSDTTSWSTTPLQALDLSTGMLAWSHDFGDVFSVGQPTASGGKLYIQHCNHGADTKLWRFDAATGNVEWGAPLSAQWERYWAPLVSGDTVYVDGGSYGGLYGIGKESGDQVFFSNALEQYDEWAPAMANGLVFTFVEGNLRAHSPQTGAVQWTTHVNWSWAGWSMNTSPVIGDGRAYVVAPPSLHAINLSTKAIVWSSNSAYKGMPATAEGVVYALNGGSLAARDAATGAAIWAFQGDGTLSFPPVIAAGYVYVSSQSNTYALDATTGAQVWTDSYGGWLSVASGKLIVARTNGTLAAYNLSL